MLPLTCMREHLKAFCPLPDAPANGILALVVPRADCGLLSELRGKPLGVSPGFVFLHLLCLQQEKCALSTVRPSHAAQCALREALLAQTEAKGLGLDWPDIGGVLDKAQEELDELRDALARGDRAHARSELGDLFFAAVNLSRFLEADPGHVLQETTDRFRGRCGAVADAVRRAGKDPLACSIEELDRVWEAVKRDGSGERQDP